MNIAINIQQAREPIAVMQLQGDIDASNFVQVVDKAREIYQNPARNLVIDLSEVPGISATGLVAIHKIALLYSGVPDAIMHPDQTHNSTARKRVKLLNPQLSVD